MHGKLRFYAIALSLLLWPWSVTMHAAEPVPKKAQAAAEFTGVHRMPATVIDFDHETGIVDLKTSVGELKVHFPPAALKDLKKGDAVQLQLGLRKAKTNE